MTLGQPYCVHNVDGVVIVNTDYGAKCVSKFEVSLEHFLSVL